MVVLRFGIILLLSVVLDLAAPMVPEVTEGPHEAQVVARVPQGRQSARSVRDFSVPSAGTPTRTSEQRLQATSWQPPARPMTSGWIRKTPPSVPDSSAAPEDH